MPSAAKMRKPTKRRPAEAPDATSGRDRLFLAAIRLFGAKGYAATSVRDIVQAAGVTAPTLYHHFGNKEGLYLAIARAGREHLERARREALAAGGSASERIRHLCRTHFARRRESAHVTWAVERIMSDPMQVGPSIDFRALARDRVRQFQHLVEEGVARGEFRRCVPRHVALALVGAIETASRPYLADAGHERLDDDLEGMLAVILSGITPGARRKRRADQAEPLARRTRDPHPQVRLSRKRTGLR